MYALVIDVESYPEFLPWCVHAQVHTGNDTHSIASLSLAVARLKYTFTTENHMEPGRSINIQLVKGPFKDLKGYWRFEPIDEKSCAIALKMNYEFKSRLLNHTIGKAFYLIVNSLVDAFAQRAQQVYGRR
jgi:ribosome-associated toxin RatA of RatAB toxin-antitoxin module